MYGYPKIWTSLLDQEWWLAATANQRYTYLMCILACKMKGDCDTFSFASWRSFSDFTRLEYRTARASVRHWCDIGEAKLKENSAGTITVTMVNYVKNQRRHDYTVRKITQLTETETETETYKERKKERKNQIGPAGPQIASRSGLVKKIFEHWKKTMGHERSLLDAKRKRAIGKGIVFSLSAKLDPAGACEAAIDGCKSSPYHMGDNDRHAVYDELDLIFRDAGRFEKFYSAGITAKKENLQRERNDRMLQRIQEQTPEPPKKIVAKENPAEYKANLQKIIDRIGNGI